MLVCTNINDDYDQKEMPIIRIIAALSNLLLGHKVFDWLCLFDGTGASAWRASYGAKGLVFY